MQRVVYLLDSTDGLKDMSKLSDFAFRNGITPPEPGNYECDGCGKVVHSSRIPDCGFGVHTGCKNHMGWMKIGGKAWHAYHDEGKHPMEAVTEQVKQALTKRMAN